jgi:hypothetical protein
MEIMTTTIKRTPNRQAAITGLAVVGFVTLIIMGIMLAIYTARFVPEAANRVGSAAVYLSQVFSPKKDVDLTVVPQVPFDGTTASTSTATSTTATSSVPLVTVPTHPTVPATTAGAQTSTTYPAGGTHTPATLYGQPDIAVHISQTGYLTGNDTNTFVGGTTVPSGLRPAVKFMVTNVGTNASGQWYFKADLPTTSSYTFNSDVQQSLLPGEHIEYTLGFDRAATGSKTITVTVDPDHKISESNELNNVDSTAVTIK